MCTDLLMQVKQLGVSFKEAEELQELVEKVNKWK